MFRKSIFAAVLLGFLALGFWAWRDHYVQAQAPDKAAAAEKDKRTLNTSGSATIRVKPDAARVFFRVETYAATIKEARAENSKQVQKILDALDALKIPNLKRKSVDVNVSLVTDHQTKGQLPRVLGYHITHSFTVLVENEDAVKLAESASRVLDTALAQGATGVDRILFFKKETEELRRQALTRAVESALGNARAMLAGANRTMVDISNINGQPQYGYRVSNDFAQNTHAPIAGDESGTPLVAGDLEITCSVNITCTY